MEASDSALAKACCADLYQSGIARAILGETRHPGGLRLTNRLGRLMDIGEGDLLVDLAAGNGASALALSRAFRCRVVGLEYGRAATEEALAHSRNAPVPGRASFLQGDAELPPLKSGAFDGVLLECSLSIFSDKERAMAQAAALLKPGGKMGMSDVTVAPGSLPDELRGTLGQMLCLTEALDVEGYIRLLENAGLTVIKVEDASHEVSDLLAQVKAGLALLFQLRAPLHETELPIPVGESEQPVNWADLVDRVADMVTAGQLGYWLFLAAKRQQGNPA